MSRQKDRINTKAELLEYMQRHRDEQLQFRHGLRSGGWWWMRKGKSEHTTHVHANAAHAVVRNKLVIHIGGDWKTSNYKLA